LPLFKNLRIASVKNGKNLIWHFSQNPYLETQGTRLLHFLHVTLSNILPNTLKHA